MREYKTTPVIDRLVSHLRICEGSDGCWEWTGYVKKNGYGTINLGHGAGMAYAHRVAYEAFVGPITPGLCVCHSCDNPKCCNPRHLFAGTQKDNLEDCSKKGRMHPGCDNGQAKLTDELVREVRERYARGELQREIAASLGMSQTSIGDVVRRVTWRHVP